MFLFILKHLLVKYTIEQLFFPGLTWQPPSWNRVVVLIYRTLSFNHGTKINRRVQWMAKPMVKVMRLLRSPSKRGGTRDSSHHSLMPQLPIVLLYRRWKQEIFQWCWFPRVRYPGGGTSRWIIALKFSMLLWVAMRNSLLHQCVHGWNPSFGLSVPFLLRVRRYISLQHPRKCHAVHILICHWDHKYVLLFCLCLWET